MKKYIFLLSLLLLFSCQKKEYFRDFISVTDVVNYGREVSKPSLVCLVNDDNKKLPETLVENFVCYIIHDPMKTILGKIVQPSEYPMYFIVGKDSIVSFFSCNEFDKILGIANKEQLLTNLIHYDFGNKDVVYLNNLLKLYECLRVQDDYSVIDLNYLDSLIKVQNKFYGKYLLARLYESIDIEKADEMYNSLWVNSTTTEMRVYPEEFIEIMKNKDRLISVGRNDIQFDYTEYDFGNIAPYEEVICKFYFVNNGSKKFVIHNVITTCGCTVPSWNRQPINPSRRDSISVKFKTDHKGVNQKTIVIEGNCEQKIKLKIKASVS